MYKKTIQAELDAVVNEFKSLNDNLINLRNSLKCDDVHAHIQKLENSVCVDFTDNLYNFYVLTFVSVLLVIVSSFFTCNQKKDDDYMEYHNQMFVGGYDLPRKTSPYAFETAV